MALGSGNIQINVGASGLTDDIVRQVRTAEKKIRPMSVSLNDKGFRQPLGRISGDIAEFQKSLDASVARTLAFGAAVGVLNAVTQGFKAMISSAVEVEKALTDINVILNLNASSLADFSSKLFDTAKNTGQSFQTVAEAAVELSRQGLGAEETLGRINDAMILTRLSGMEAAKSVETLTAAVNSFGDTAITTTEIVNKLATVDAAFAVSTEDLANGLARAGATAQSAKVDLDQLLAAVTSVQQTTARGGAVIGNAFKSIFTRLQRGGVREALEEIGVATTDAAGNIRGALDILKDYSGVYGSLTDSQKAFTDELIAGVFQINNLKALVKDLGSDYSIYERALTQSNSATDEAVRRNEKLQGTLSTLINEAAVSAKELASTLGSLIATPAIENLLNLFNSISGALGQALDPEKGSKLMQGMFKAIGGFISGPGLILIGVAFVKLFKFITGQSLKAVKEIFKIGSATNKIAETEAKIGFLLKNNKSLYEAISNSALSHEQKEELVLQTIKQQNNAYALQQKLISRISSSRAIGAAVSSTAKASGFIPARSRGYVPNFANGIEGAISSERAAISAGEGGASRSAKPKVLKNFPMGGGRNQTIVANTDEVIVPKFGGSSGSAIFNKNMIKKSGGVPDGAIPVASGYIPNFASSLEKDKKYKQFLTSQDGLDIDVERQLGGFGMLSAKGVRGRQSSSLKQISAFTPVENNSIIEKISGSKLTKDDKKFISTVIARKRTTFSNIGTSSITEMSSPEVSSKVEGKAGAINDLIQPNIANAVASVASRIYNGILGDEVGKGLVNQVRDKANVDQSIVSPSVEGGIFESALRLGSLESAKSLGRDKHDGIWDFEESGPITKDMQDIFFQGYGISKGDAKRSGGAQSLREVVQKSHKNHFKEPLESIYEQHWRPFFEAGNKMTKGERSKERKKGQGSVAARSEGFIPNYVFQDNNGLSKAAMKSQPETGSQFNVSDILNITRRSDQDKKDFKKQFPKKKLLPHLIKNLRNEKYRNVINNNFARDKDARTNFGRTHYPSITEGDFKSKSKEYGIVGNAAAYIYSNSSRKTPDWSSKIENLGKEKGKSIVRPKLKNYIKEPHYGFDSVSIRPPEANSTEIGFREIQERIKQYLGKNIPKTGKGNINIGDILNSDKDIFPKTSAKIDDNWRNNYSKILDNNKDYYIKQIEAYNKGSKSTSTGRIFEELLNSGLKAYNQEMTYHSRLDNDNWDLYNITQKEQEVLGLKQAKFGDIKTTLGGTGNKLSFMKKFIREPTGGRASGFIPARAGGYVPNFANEIEGAAGSEESAIFNKDILKRSEGISDETIPAASGFTPNYAEKLKGFGRDSMIKDKTIKGRRTLDVQYIRGFAGEGAGIFRNILKTLINADKSGRPYSDIDAGMVVGPRIPSVLVKGKQLLDRTRKTKKSPPLTRIKGTFNPSGLMMKLDSYKDDITADGSEYLSGEEQELISSLKTLGVDPNEKRMVELEGLPFFKRGFASGHVPNFMDLFRGVKAPKGSNLKSKDIYKSDPRRSRKFKASDVYDLNTLHDYLRSHVENEKTSSLISSSTNIKTARDFATTKDPSKQGFIGKASMSHKRMYNPRKVDKLVNFLMKRRGWSEAKSVQWFANQARKKPIGFHMKRWLDTDLFKKFAFEDEVAILNKSSFADKDRGMAIASSGFVPNFANSLEESIVREKSVLSDQGSGAKVYVDQDKRLKGSKNPMGLLVANTRDEPLNGSQGVDRAISTGLNPKNHGKGMSGGYVPNYISGGGIQQTNFQSPKFKEMANETKKLGKAASKTAGALSKQTKSSDGLLGKVFALEFALSTLTSTMGVSATGTQSTVAGISGLAAVFPDLIGKLGIVGKALAVVGVAAGIAYDIYRNLYDAEVNNIKALESEIATREKSINIISQNIESLDKFATSAAKFSAATGKGDIEASGKILQNIFEQAKSIRSLNPKAFEDLINSIGDTDKFNESIKTFKSLAEQGKNLKTFSNDFAGVVKKFNEELDSKQFLGIFDVGKGVDVSQFTDEIKSMSDLLTSGLSDDKIKKLSKSLKDFDPSSNSASRALLGLQDILGEFDAPTRSWIRNNESITQGIIKQVQASSNYSSAIITAKNAFKAAQNPVVNLSKKINELGTALEIAGQSSDRAFNALYNIGQIDVKSRSERQQATGTVTQENSIKGTSAAKIQNDLLKSTQETKKVLRSFASDLIKANKESGTVLSGGMKTLIEGVKGGNVSSKEALTALLQVQKTGSPEEKKVALEALQKLRAINATQVASQKMAEANARAQLAALKSQQIATLRNTQFSEQQINVFKNFDKILKEDGTTAKTSLEKITEMNNGIATLISIGADQDILAELTEIKAKASELENLRAAFSGITGKEIGGGSLEELRIEISKLVRAGGTKGLSADRSKFFRAALKSLQDALARREEGGVKGEKEVEAAQLIEIKEDSISLLASKMAEVIGSSIAESLNIGPEIAEAVNKSLNPDELSKSIQSLSETNEKNSQKNAEHQQKLNEALIGSLKDSNFSGSADSLSKAASALERAVEKITIAPIGGAATGFVPSFSPIGEGVSRAIKTERALGGRPVVDYNKQVGTYVRDGNTQNNFSAVKRDHPEGIKNATRNSKTIQGHSKAGGFTPNFARRTEFEPLTTAFDNSPREILENAYFGNKPFVDQSKLKNIYAESGGVGFSAKFIERAAGNKDYTVWDSTHPNIIEKINAEDRSSFEGLALGPNNFPKFLEYAKSLSRPGMLDALGGPPKIIFDKLTEPDITDYSTAFDRSFDSGLFKREAPSVSKVSANGKFVSSIGEAFENLHRRKADSFDLGSSTRRLSGLAERVMHGLPMEAKILKQGGLGLFADHKVQGDEYKKLAAIAASSNLDVLGTSLTFSNARRGGGTNYITEMDGGPEFLTKSVLNDEVFKAIRPDDRFRLPMSIASYGSGDPSEPFELGGIKYNKSPSIWDSSLLNYYPEVIEEFMSQNNKVIGTQRAQRDTESKLPKETLDDIGVNFNPILLEDAESENVYFSELLKKINIFKKWHTEIEKSALNNHKAVSYVSSGGAIVPPKGGNPQLEPYGKDLSEIPIGGYTPADTAGDFVSKALNGTVSNKVREVNTKFIQGFYQDNMQDAADNILPRGKVEDSFEQVQLLLKERQARYSDILKGKNRRGEDVGGVKAQAEDLKAKQAALADAKAAAEERLNGADDAAKKVEEEAVKKEQTDLQKERNLLYLGLLGKQAQETRESLPAFQVQERINKVQNVLGKYPPYIDNLIRPRKRRAEEASKLSNKFAKASGDPRKEKYRNIQNKNESIVNLLEERKSIYQSPEGLAHFYYQDASKLSKVEGERVGASIWDTDPNYLQLFNDLKKKYAIGEVGAEKQLAERGIEPRDVLEKYPEYKDDKMANIFAQIQGQKGNNPSAFSEKFKASGPQERIQLMQSVGAQSADPDEIDGFFKDENLLEKITALSVGQGSEPEVSFLLNEMLSSKGNDMAKEAVLSKIKSMGLPFMSTQTAGSFLNEQKIDVFGAGGFKSSVGAVDPTSVSDLITFMTDNQIENYVKNNKAMLEKEGIADSPKLIDLITGKKQNLLDYPVYLNYRENQGEGLLGQLVQSKLGNKESVGDLGSWESKYEDMVSLQTLSENQTKNGYDGFYGNYTLSKKAKQPNELIPENKPIFEIQDGKEVNPFEKFGNRRTTPSAAARRVIESFSHGTNESFEKLLSNDKHPFPELGVPVGDRFDQFKERAYKISESIKPAYAPAGYGKKYQEKSPSGKPSMIKELLDTYSVLSKPKKADDAKEKAAGGFVPNFSAIAGEIAASKMAGYESPVKSSQVKTMNIPGHGKTAYNTQESVFKLPGMSQPFITPPSSSKAAKPYKKEVEKKFNFNPYKKTAADGFVPNFAAGLDSAAFESSMKSFSSSVSGFERYVSNFDKAISSLDFREFAASSRQIFNSAREFSSQSSTIKEAAVLFNEGSNKISQSGAQGSVDFSPMTSAASTINQGLSQLSNKLGQPIEVDSSAITQSMSQLTTALGNVRGSIDVKIPTVNVAVGGASEISSSISSILKSQIPGIVTQSMSAQKQNIIDEVKRSIFG